MASLLPCATSWPTGAGPWRTSPPAWLPTAAASSKALDDSTADLAILPASQYFTYSDDVDLLMTATKPGVSVNSLNAADWNGSA